MQMQGVLCLMFLGTLFPSFFLIYECVSINTLKQLTTNIDIISPLLGNYVTYFIICNAIFMQYIKKVSKTTEILI